MVYGITRDIDSGKFPAFEYGIRESEPSGHRHRRRRGEYRSVSRIHVHAYGSGREGRGRGKIEKEVERVQKSVVVSVESPGAYEYRLGRYRHRGNIGRGRDVVGISTYAVSSAVGHRGGKGVRAYGQTGSAEFRNENPVAIAGELVGKPVFPDGSGGNRRAVGIRVGKRDGDESRGQRRYGDPMFALAGRIGRYERPDVGFRSAGAYDDVPRVARASVVVQVEIFDGISRIHDGKSRETRRQGKRERDDARHNRVWYGFRHVRTVTS